MSLHAESVGSVPEETVSVTWAAFPKGNVCMRLRDVLGVVYDDESFRALFAARGRPAECPWRLALVTVMQSTEGLSDRQAAEAVVSMVLRRASSCISSTVRSYSRRYTG
jgi:transposase